jgi:hypothetical protein
VPLTDLQAWLSNPNVVFIKTREPGVSWGRIGRQLEHGAASNSFPSPELLNSLGRVVGSHGVDVGGTEQDFARQLDNVIAVHLMQVEYKED